MDLTEAIAGVIDGTLDAQENPFANTVTYGVHRHHPYQTMSGLFYLSRPLFANRAQFDGWPEDLRRAFAMGTQEAVAFQRDLAEAEAVDARRAIEEAGGEIAELSQAELAAFAASVALMLDDAHSGYGAGIFELMEGKP